MAVGLRVRVGRDKEGAEEVATGWEQSSLRVRKSPEPVSISEFEDSSSLGISIGRRAIRSICDSCLTGESRRDCCVT